MKGLDMNRYVTCRAVIVDKRDDGEASELGEYHTISDARKAIEEYRRQGSMIACNGPTDMIERWTIESLYDDDILQSGV
jgi:hypothetical protein